MTIARILLVFAATPLLVCCGGNAGIRQGEPAQKAQQASDEPIVCPEPEPLVKPSVEPFLFVGLIPPVLVGLGACSPIPKEIERWGGGCTASGGTQCFHIDGRVYLWNPMRNCKKPGFRNSGEGENDCYETAIPWALAVLPAQTRVPAVYCRKKDDRWVEILWVSDDGFRTSFSMKKLGWAKEDCRSLCPEVGECLVRQIYRAPDCR
jgi:hypothetical protein